MRSGGRRCYVHIGPPKTGTSYLQGVLWASQPALAAQGLVLPLRKRDHFHVALALRSISRPSAAAGVTTVLGRLRAAVNDVTDADLLITQEQLAPATEAEAEQLVNLLSGWQVHVVMTARDLARQIPSGWQQGVKKRRTMPYDDFLDAVVRRRPASADFWRHQDLGPIAQAWSSAVSRSRVHVVTVPPPGAPPTSLLERFCTVVGVQPDGLDTSAAVANTSLGHPQAELLRLVNEALGAALSGPAGSAARAGQTYLAKRVLAGQSGPAPRLPSRLNAWCRTESERTVAALQDGGYNVVGDLADLLPVFDEEEQTGDASGIEIQRAAAQALATVVTSRQRAVHRLETQQGESAKQLRRRQGQERPTRRKRRR